MIKIKARSAIYKAYSSFFNVLRYAKGTIRDALYYSLVQKYAGRSMIKKNYLKKEYSL